MVALDYEKGDPVYVNYPFPSPNYFTPVLRTVGKINVNDVGDSVRTEFDDGVPVEDSNAAQTIFTTQLAAATALTNDIIARSAAVAALDTATTSQLSAAGQVVIGLGRVDQ